ncbi:n-(5'-phosphoribosyl)anthranilate isomerase 1 [Hibiscus syriacus]|uniref:N-(5'-phosphoribosyl)anthranilate isomerase 1 n=1 Tax=Hibiscus syriacus TaxID=106335 RepID=A0A6A2Z5C6_HIBSY|nr:n-(5'-phosphoribosyl)anthranilate isomerase 1 [Hibiscus syriacus]
MKNRAKTLFFLSISLAFSTHKQQQYLPNLYGATAAPPPTPSTQTNRHNATSGAAVDALSKLLHRLPPTLSLPKRRSSPSVTTSPPTLSLSDPNPNHLLLSSASELGFFQLTNHGIPSQLANSAETEALSLFELARDQKEHCFPKNWPLGFDVDDEEEDGDGKVGFENPIGEDPTRFCSLMWITEGLNGDRDKPSGGFYPYVIGLQYQIRSQKYSLSKDSGLVSVSPQVDSIMVTLGDIAQVWSNGKVSKVRGRAVVCSGDGNNRRCISMSLLVTIPVDSRVETLVSKVIDEGDIGIGDEDEGQVRGNKEEQEERVFNSFSFEDYAWGVYHDSYLFKDPLDRYRV